MQKFETAPKKIMQNDLRQTGKKHCICVRNNMHKLGPEIMDYSSVWLKKGSLLKATYNYKDQRAHQFCAISGGSSRPGLSDADHAKIPNIYKKSSCKKKIMQKHQTSAKKTKQTTSFAPYLAAVLAQVSRMARRWSVCSNRLRTSTANRFGTTFVSSLVRPSCRIMGWCN